MTDYTLKTPAQIQASNPVTPALTDFLLLWKAGAMGGATVQQLADLIIGMIADGAPGALDTLNELAAALGDDANFAATVTTALAGKAPLSAVAPVGAELLWPAATPPDGWLEEDGSAVLVASYPELAAAIYCGDANNATAEWGYKATTNVSPGSNRSTTGTYIVLPDARGEFIRGWDHGRGVDSGRGLWSSQADAFQGHSVRLGQGKSGDGGSLSASTTITYAVPWSATTGVTLDTNWSLISDGTHGTPRVASETRGRNAARMIIIKY